VACDGSPTPSLEPLPTPPTELPAGQSAVLPTESTTELPTVLPTEPIPEPLTEPTTEPPTEPPLTPDELDKLLTEQPLAVLSVKYVIQHARHKNLYPDMLQAVIQNNSEHDIRDAVIAFVGWDENRLPVKIVAQRDWSGGAYVAECNFFDINLVPTRTFGNNSGMPLDSNSSEIPFLKAIAVSYESFDGDKWTNPYFDAWLEMYEGKRLAN
jgi:hypothetical protein